MVFQIYAIYAKGETDSPSRAEPFTYVMQLQAAFEPKEETIEWAAFLNRNAEKGNMSMRWRTPKFYG